jgi:hypothetical protein
MAKIGKGELKRALIAAEAKRSKYQDALQSDLDKHPKLLSSRRAGEKLFAEFFREAGLDAKKLGTLQKKHSAELQGFLQKQRAEAIKRASGVKDTVHSSILSQSKAIKLLAANQPFSFGHFPFISLDKPFLILGTPHDNVISASNIESFKSWAKILVESGDSSGQVKVGFYFLWNNPTGLYALINASTFMSANGFCKTTARGGWSGIDPTQRYSDLGVVANFGLWGWWQQPPTSTPYSTYEFTSLQSSASFWDESKCSTVSDGASLNYSLFVVPPNGVVIFEVSLAVGYSNGNGHILADFESGDFKIGCPVVVVSLLSSPTVSVAG